MTEKIPINELLNIELNKPIKKEIQIIEPDINDPREVDKFEKDFEESRRNMLLIMDTAKDVLEEIHLIARDKEGAREYEALNNILRTIGDSSSVLLKLHEQRKKYKEMKTMTNESGKNGTNINNAVFVGSASELRAMLKKD